MQFASLFCVVACVVIVTVAIQLWLTTRNLSLDDGPMCRVHLINQSALLPTAPVRE